MGGLGLVVIFLVWAISTIKTESRNIEHFHRIGDKENEQKSAEHGAIAIVYLGIFVALVLVALVMTIAE